MACESESGKGCLSVYLYVGPMKWLLGASFLFWVYFAHGTRPAPNRVQSYEEPNYVERSN